MDTYRQSKHDCAGWDSVRFVSLQTEGTSEVLEVLLLAEALTTCQFLNHERFQKKERLTDIIRSHGVERLTTTPVYDPSTTKDYGQQNTKLTQQHSHSHKRMIYPLQARTPVPLVNSLATNGPTMGRALRGSDPTTLRQSL